MDSPALALTRRTGTGRLERIKQFYLQNLLRASAFSVFKINTKIKINPGDLNAKRFGGERKTFFARLISLYSPSDDDPSHWKGQQSHQRTVH